MSDEEPIVIEPAEAGERGFRVVRLGEPLRREIRTRRAATGQTVREFLAEAVGHELPRLLSALGELGVTAEAGGAGRPARLPLSAAHARSLREAAAASGLPASLLLRVALGCLARRKRRRHRPARIAAGCPRSRAGSARSKHADGGRVGPSRRRERPRDAEPAMIPLDDLDTPED